MDSKRVEQIIQSSDTIDVSYNGMPVWIESIRGDEAEVTLIEEGRRIHVPASALTQAGPMQTM